MKKLLVAAVLAFAASTASATIAGGSHDMSLAYNTAKYGTPNLSSCQFCHAPHFGTVTPPAGGPLWNRGTPTATYTLYTSGTLSTVAQTGKALGTNSYTCLSCHDGVSDMGATLIGSRGFTPVTVMDAATFANVGVVLTNDHPVGITYNTADTTLVTPAPGVPTATAVGLYAGKVECGSCHDPHGLSDQVSGGASFLREASSTICVSCHSK